MKTKILIVSCLLVTIQGFSQQNYWVRLKDNTLNREDLKPRQISPKSFSLYQLDLEKIKSDLTKAPQRFSKDESLIIKFPDAEGKTRDYIVQEASVMEPELQLKFSEIRSYTGWEKNHPENTIRFSLTPETGISVMYFDHWEVSYLDSYTKDNLTFILYKRKDLPKNDKIFECHVEDNLKNNTSANKAPLVSDGQFRTYRLALAATAEYTNFHGGTLGGAMSAMATTMTRVNAVFEKTISTTMVMVANNNLLIYTNSATDPYANGAAGVMNNQNQANVDSVIGPANYDIGHVFGKNGGGFAGVGVICIAGFKARGATGSPAPVGDPFDIDFVAHEMGHQFGAYHTFRASSGSCSGNANDTSAYEPGGGTTIMAYTGICGNNNIQSNSDAYFHAASVIEMYNVLQRATDCALKNSNNNGVPIADAGVDYNIPKGTAFVLTGMGADPNGDALTYLWEQYDNTNNVQPPVSTATEGPVYRSVIPTASPSRYFPVLSSVVANNLVPEWEVTPSVSRILNFSLLVNDNKSTGNQAARDAMVVTVTNDGPFTVTSQAISNAVFDGNSQIPVNWNVAGTNTGAINTQNVTILLSKDGGLTFNTILAASVPNNGNALITLPNENIASARIMVKALDNIYYALNTANFSVNQSILATTEADMGSFFIYPNPSHDIVNISLKNASQKASYTLFDTSGRLFKNGNFKGKTQIKVNELMNGNYLIAVTLDSGVKMTEKLIIKK